MKQRLFSQWWIGLAQTVTLASLTAFTTIATTNQPSHAKGQTFYCGKSKGIPITFVGIIGAGLSWIVLFIGFFRTKDS
jgi:hypothetical protein